MQKKLVDQLRHVDATPKVLNELESTVVGAVRHLYEVTALAAQEVERLEAENRMLKKLCKQHGIDLRVRNDSWQRSCGLATTRCRAKAMFGLER